MRKTIAAFFLALWSTIALAQAPTPVPALPDTPRLTQYSISSSQCVCTVNFALYGDGTDVDNWLQVFIGTTAYLSTDATFGWTITSPSGSIGNIARPITNAILTFNQAQTGTVTIVGARRPRRLTQFQENRGVPARDLNQAITDEIAQNREEWDRSHRALLGQPGEIIGLMPPAATRANQVLAFDASGNPTVTAVPSSIPTGAVTGPGSSSLGHLVVWGNTLGTLLADGGALAGTPNGTTCGVTPALLTYQQFANTTLSPTGTTLNFWDGTNCVPWATLNQTAHTIEFTNSVGGCDVTTVPEQVGPFVFGISSCGVYAQNAPALGGIFQISGYADNTGTTPTVGVFGQGRALGTNSRSWGGNFVAYCGAAGAFCQGIEIDFGVNTGSTQQANGLDINAAGTTGSNLYVGLSFDQLASVATFADAIRFSNFAGNQPYTHALIYAPNNVNPLTTPYGINLVNANFATAAIATKNFTVLPTGVVNLTGTTSGTLSLAASATGGHLNLAGSGSTPLPGSCTGFTPATGSTDMAGHATYTSSATCNFQFGTAFANAPHCVVSPGSSNVSYDIVASTTTLGISFSAAQTAFSWICFGS